MASRDNIAELPGIFEQAHLQGKRNIVEVEQHASFVQIDQVVQRYCRSGIAENIERSNGRKHRDDLLCEISLSKSVRAAGQAEQELEEGGGNYYTCTVGDWISLQGTAPA